VKHNIFWCAGIDSTYLVCRRLIMERVPIETYYLNFPCDGYDAHHHTPVFANPETRLSSLDIENENIIQLDPYGRKSYGRLNRDIEVKVMYKLREIIIEQFPFTEELFPPLILVNSVEIDRDFLEKMLHLQYEYDLRYNRAEQTLHMVKYSLDKNEMFEIAYEGDDNSHGKTVIDEDYLTYSIATRLLRIHLTDDFKISSDIIPELELYKNISLPISKTWKKDMVEDAKKYNFTNILENTWSCRFPKSNGDICNGVWERKPSVRCLHNHVAYKELNRKTNYNDILNVS
jgi:hypothetical protein